MIRVAIPSVPSEPMTSAHQVGPGRIEPLAAEVNDLAVGQHELERRHVGDREAVLEAVGAAGVLGDVAADRADLLARRVGRVVEALAARQPASPRGSSRPARRRRDRCRDRARGSGSCARARSRSRRRCGSAPPESPVPAPRATNGTPCSSQRRTTACTSAVERGSATRAGTTRWPVSPSHSYVRSCSGSWITASGPSAASIRATSSGVRLIPWPASVSGLRAFSGQRFSSRTARRPPTQSMPIASRASAVALPRCGARTTFSSSQEARVDIRLALVDVEGRARDLAFAKSVDERSLVDDRAAGRVDEDGRPLHQAKRGAHRPDAGSRP